MTGSQSSLTISLIFVVLFSIAIIGFAISFAHDNNSEISIANDENITVKYYSRTQDNLSDLREDSQDTFKSVSGTTIEPGSDVIKSSGSFTITWKNVFSSFKNIIEIPKTAIFGGEKSQFAIFFSALAGILLFLFALYIIKTWRGNP